MKEKKINRRQFLGQSAAGIAGLFVVPSLITACGSGVKPDDKFRLGFIGLGQQAMGLLNGFISLPDVEVLAGCDVYQVKRERFQKRVDAYNQNNHPNLKVDLYEDYKDLLAREDINTIVIATPDHSHAMIAIAACNAKKNVYLEKPLTFTIQQGKDLVKAVRDNKVTLAVGSQQRSDNNFQHAVKMVQEGRLGKIDRVFVSIGAPPKPYDLPEQPIPAGLNWDKWQEPLPYKVHYNEELNPPISLDPESNENYWGAWRWYKETGGGFTTDWGAHMFDIAQWALGMDKNGPIKVSPPGVDGAEFLTFTYKNGIIMTEQNYDEQHSKGVKFWGDKGWIEVSRGHFRASDDNLLPPAVVKEEGAYETKAPHYSNFIEAIRSKTDPIASVEIGHSTCIVCTLGNMAFDLNRTLNWNPEKQEFVNDSEASNHMLYKG